MLSFSQLILIKNLITFMVINTIFRVIFFALFVYDSSYTLSNILNATYLGLKFDLRISIILTIPLILFLALKKIQVQLSYITSFIWSFVAFFIILLFHSLNIGTFSYLNIGVNSTLLKFLDNPLISLEMMIESYPIVLITIGLIIFSFIFFKLFRIIYKDLEKRDTRRLKTKIVSYSLISLFAITGLYGKFSYYPLRWSEAFSSGSNEISFFTINPISYFFNTLKFKNSTYDKDIVKKYYPYISQYLNVDHPNVEKLSFRRVREPQKKINSNNPNIVLIVLESVASHKSNLYGNPLKSTPYLQEIAKNGLFFDRFYTPSQATARSMFTAVTGLPDLSRNKTATRNPLIINQHTIINSFKNYQKMYFLGGSANWGNIRGIFSHNINGIQIFEEGSFDSPRTDVWGLSDYHLFIEAHKIFKEQDKKKPFFAVIQSASYHRPFTVPDNIQGFKKENISTSQLSKYGFSSLKEFNSLRFQDFSFGNFMQLAKKSSYFKNTIFLIHGDHGLTHNNATHITDSERTHNLVNLHVPFIIYSPEYIKPKVNSKIMSQLDILPSLASLLGVPYENNTLGRDIFSEKDQGDAFLFFWYETPPLYGVINDQFYLNTRPEKGTHRLYQYKEDNYKEDVSSKFTKQTDDLLKRSHGLYQTGKYLMYHNSK